MESTYFLLLQNKIQFYKEIFLHLSFVLTNKCTLQIYTPHFYVI